MSLVTLINSYFRTATKEEVEKTHDKILLSERQEYIFNSYYIKKKSADFIADSLNVSTPVIHKELKVIRDKLFKVIATK